VAPDDPDSGAGLDDHKGVEAKAPAKRDPHRRHRRRARGETWGRWSAPDPERTRAASVTERPGHEPEKKSANNDIGPWGVAAGAPPAVCISMTPPPPQKNLKSTTYAPPQSLRVAWGVDRNQKHEDRKRAQETGLTLGSGYDTRHATQAWTMRSIHASYGVGIIEVFCNPLILGLFSVLLDRSLGPSEP
jgi:hypothetical protein